MMINFKESEIYKEVLKHRNQCKKWGKDFCLDCFGGGLTVFVNKFIEEEINELNLSLFPENKKESTPAPPQRKKNVNLKS